MATNKIYRFEHKEIYSENHNKVGLGVYVGSPINTRWYNEMRHEHKDSAHPSIWEDKIPAKANCDMKDLYCGFPTIKKALKWFEGYVEYLLNADYVLMEYKLSEEPIYGKSEKQLMFNVNSVISKKQIEVK